MTVKIEKLTRIFTYAFLLNACDGEMLLRTTPCAEGEVKQGDVCVNDTESVQSASDNSKKIGSSNCKDINLNKLQTGESVTMCDGSIAVGKLILPAEVPACSNDGQQDCVNKSNFKAIDTTQLDPSKIAIGTIISGVTGTLRSYRQCRNYSDLSTFDSSYPPSNMGWNLAGFNFAPAAVNTGTDQITFSSNHGLITNSPVRFSSTTSLPAPLVAGTTYYAIYNSNTVVRLASVLNGSQIDITTQGVGTHSAHDAADLAAQYFDTIDDHNNNLANSPSNNPWGTNEYLCDASNFVNVASTSAPLMASGLTPSNGNVPFTQIWQDQISGLYVSNILYDGAPNSSSWSDLLRMCESLNNASAGNGWRLPTQKELLQLYINGISKVPTTGGSFDVHFWSSTMYSTNSGMVLLINLATGAHNGEPQNARWRRALCVR